MNEDFLGRKLQQRRDGMAFRQLTLVNGKADFCSNDYLGLVTNRLIPHERIQPEYFVSGSTGSRLISGNSRLAEEAERSIAAFHGAEAGLIYNSGYDANIGLLGCVPQRNDTVLYDQLSHASIRDGIRLSHAHAFSFQHNDVEDLEKKLQSASGRIFVVTESVFSMDGDVAPLQAISELCESYNAMLIVDEAHATGVIGARGEGLVSHLGLEKKCFARVHTFGKAVGCHGAIVLGSAVLRDYLVNFSRAFIYTTALPGMALGAICAAYSVFPPMNAERSHLEALIRMFQGFGDRLCLLKSSTPIQAAIVPGNEEARNIASRCQSKGFDVRAILYPSVPLGRERLRIVLHSFNTEDQVRGLADTLVSG